MSEKGKKEIIINNHFYITYENLKLLNNLNSILYNKNQISILNNVFDEKVNSENNGVIINNLYSHNFVNFEKNDEKGVVCAVELNDKKRKKFSRKFIKIQKKGRKIKSKKKFSKDRKIRNKKQLGSAFNKDQRNIYNKYKKLYYI